MSVDEYLKNIIPWNVEMLYNIIIIIIYVLQATQPGMK
jgi:hypothetical protein